MAEIPMTRSSFAMESCQNDVEVRARERENGPSVLRPDARFLT